MMTDTEYLKLAYSFARQSKDPSTQNGAILVNPRTGGIPVAGWNDIHLPLHDLPERRTKRPDKYKYAEYAEHAERMAILTAARYGIATSGLWLYVPWFACTDCARAIIYSRISRVVGHDIPQHHARSDWQPDLEIAEQMFLEAGVEVVRLKEKLGVKFRFNGEEIEV